MLVKSDMVQQLSAANSPASRNYKPQDHGVGIIHIGPGAFHRAHQAVYTDAALEKAGGDWRICAVSMNSRGTIDHLNAQDGRYLVAIRSDQETEYQTIGSIAGGIAFADDGADKIQQGLENPDIKIVSFTVTEKAYILPDDLSSSDENIFCMIAKALKSRRAQGRAALTLLSCDNVPNNGAIVRQAVLKYADLIDESLGAWINENASFPSTMVDRITPASTDDLIEEVEKATGYRDPLAIETEAFSQWIIEDDFCNGRPVWDQVGVLLVKDVKPYEHMKLRMLNGAHSMLAYAGFLSGHTYVRDVMEDEVLVALIARHMKAASATLEPLAGIEFSTYASSLITRFKNPNIAHETYQIAMDGSKKMLQRIFDPAMDAIRGGSDLQAFALATAVWLRYLYGQHDDGTTYALRDPMEDILSQIALEHGADAKQMVDAIFDLPDLVPAALIEHPTFKADVAGILDQILRLGMRPALAQIGDLNVE